MASFYTLRVTRSDIIVPGKSKPPDLYVKISYGEERHRTRSVNETPPQWNETFPIKRAGHGALFTIKLVKEAMVDIGIGIEECSLEEILRDNGEDVRLSLQSNSSLQQSIFLCLQPSDETKNAELFLLNLAQDLLEIRPSNYANIADNVDAIFDTAKRVAESGACQSLVEAGYSIAAFVEFGNSIANEIPYVKLAWCLTMAFLKIFASQPKFDERVKDLVKNLMNLFLVTKETSIFSNPSSSLRLTITNILGFIRKCSILILDYAPRSFLTRSVMQNKKAAIEDLESALENLKKELNSAFIRQDIIETRIEARVRISEKLRRKLEKKLQPKHEGRTDRQICLEGTRIGLLQEIGEWVRDVNAPNVFFILGRAGTGKSTIATTIAEGFQRKGQLGSHQYFLRDKSDPAFIFRTIAFDLASRSQVTAEAINAQLDVNGITSATPDRAFEILLSDPLHAISMEGKEKDNILIVLDALDECGSREARDSYIRLIKEKLQTLPPNYRFLITSRPEEDIASSEELGKLQMRHIHLDHETEDAKDDVLKYIQTKLEGLKERGRIIVDPSWPWDESMKILGEAANGLFIWGTTAVRLIESKRGYMGGELKRLVNTKSLSLGNLYASAFESSLSWDEDTKIDFSKVFSLIMFGKEQLSDIEINNLLGFDYGRTRGILECLRSLIAFQPNQSVRLYHTSLYDYLISEETRNKPWFINEEREKERISLRCFELMQGLRFNICELETSYKLNKDVLGLEERVRCNIPAPLRYSCRYWASHLLDVPYSEELYKNLDSFTFNRLLFWIEVLSLTDSLYNFLSSSLVNAITWIANRQVQLSAFLQDAHDQLHRFIEPISQSSPHIYMSFLPLMIKDSIIAEHYAKQARSLTNIEYIGNKPQMACSKQINVGSWVASISYSPDGKRIASGSWGGDISIWDAVTGRLLFGPLHGHSRDVSSVVYSRDGRYFASGSKDKTVRVWNALTGESFLRPFIGHSEDVNSIAFSGDSTLLASASDDKTLRLWKTESGAPVGEPHKYHSSPVKSVLFSPNGRFLASKSDNRIVILDGNSRKIISRSLKGHSLSFSPDNKNIASGSWDGSISLWYLSTGKVLRTISGDGMGRVYSVAYSSDGKHILSGSWDEIVRLWDVEDSNAPPKRFEGHTKHAMSVSYAPDCRQFASGSWDGTIRVWDAGRGVTDPSSEGQTGSIEAIAISPRTGKFLVSGSNNNTVCVWNAESGELVKGPLYGHLSWVTSVAFSSDENHFASGSGDKSIRIWNMIDDKFVTCNGHTDWVRSVAFSPDGSYLASGSDDNSIRVWNNRSGLMTIEPINGHTNYVSSVCYSPDEKKIVSGSRDNTVRIWNASNGRLLSSFEGHFGWVDSVSYSYDGSYIVSGSNDKIIQVWNAETGQVVWDSRTGHMGSISSVCFSPDGRWLISGSWDKAVCVWKALTGDLFFQARVSSRITSVASLPSSNLSYINFISSSYDGTIHVWSVKTGSEVQSYGVGDDGWLTESNGSLLIWIPPDLRNSLVNGPCIRTLNTRFSTKFHFSIYQGDQWTACFPSPDARVS